MSHEPFLKIGVINSPPFAIYDKNTHIWKGLGVELFKHVAEDAGFHYNFIEIKASEDLKSLADQYDIIIGDFPYSQKLSPHFHLSIPYYGTGYGILSRSTDNTKNMIMEIFHNIFSIEFIYALLIFLFFMIIIGAIFWLLEKRHNKQFSVEMGTGVFEGVCYAIFAFTGIGWEKYPKTIKGVVFGMIWACFSVLVISHVIAVTTSLLTKRHLENNINDFNDLKHMNIGAVVDNENHIGGFLHSHYFNYHPFKTLSSAIDALKSKKIEAVVASASVLGYYLKQTPDLDLKLSPLSMGKNYYGFLISPKNQNIRLINSGILKITNEMIWQKITFKYVNEVFK